MPARPPFPPHTCFLFISTRRSFHVSFRLRLAARPLRFTRRRRHQAGKRTFTSRIGFTGKACTYLLNNGDVLVAHQERSFTRLDNNLVKNAIRPSAIGKKTGSLSATGQRSAMILARHLVLAPRKGPLAYLRDVLGGLSSMTNQNDLTPLTPARCSHRNCHSYDPDRCIALTATLADSAWLSPLQSGQAHYFERSGGFQLPTNSFL
jgi:hypothetical protein